MNYSNMIEEKNLKKTFIVATLVSTIMGTFITGINLFERVGEKRDQKKRDKGQDEKLKELEAKVLETEKREKEGGRGGGRRQQDLHHSLEDGGPMIRREYDRNYARLGPRFAEGDSEFVAWLARVEKLMCEQSSLRINYKARLSCYRVPS